MKQLITFLAIIAWGFSAWAQFTLEGQIRPRAEFRDGFRMMPTEGSNAAAQVNQRTRLSLSYTSDSRISTRISLQDTRLWGQNLTMDNSPTFSIHEAWLGLHPTENIDIIAGRQELKYDTQRLLSFNDWALTGRSHDALTFQYTSDTGSRLHVGTSFNQSQNRLFETHYELNNYKTLNYIWYNTRLTDNLQSSFHLIADGYENPDDQDDFNMRYTWASYQVWDAATNLELRLYPAYQHGKTASGTDISAFYVMLEAATSIGDGVNNTLGVELFSGMDQVDPGDTFTAFSDLYGLGYARQGHMNYFINFPGDTQNAGLINPYLKNSYRLSDATTVSADLHLFFLQNDYPDPVTGEAIDAFLGAEIDLHMVYRFNAFTQILFGYSMLFGNDSMEAIRGGDSDEWAHWAFAMIRMSPTFLSL